METTRGMSSYDKITFVDEEGQFLKFCIQNSSYVQRIKYYLSKIDLDTSSIPNGLMMREQVVVKCEGDWCRGMVIGNQNLNNYVIKSIDTGCMLPCVHISNIRRKPNNCDAILDLPPQVLDLLLAFIVAKDNWTQSQLQEIRKYLLHTPVNCTINFAVADFDFGTLINNDGVVSNVLVESGYGILVNKQKQIRLANAYFEVDEDGRENVMSIPATVPARIGHQVLPSITGPAPVQEKLQINSEHVARVVCLTSEGPAKFFVHIESNEKRVHYVSLYLKRSLLPLTNFASGVMCAVFDAQRKQFVRGIINSTSGQSATVEQIDYGDVLEYPLSGLQNVPEQLSNIEPLAYEVALHDYHESLSNEILQRFNSLVMNKYLRMKVVSVDKNKTWCRLFDGNVEIGDLLLQCPQQNIDVRSRYEVKVCYVDITSKAPWTFWVQLMESLHTLAKFLQDIKMYAFQNEVPTRDPDVKDNVLAEDVRSGCWYRAQVLQVMADARYTVRSLDYGTILNVEKRNIRHCPKHFLTYLPALALECHLSDAEMVLKNAKLFAALADGNKFDLVVREKLDNLVLSVELFDMNRFPPLNIIARLTKNWDNQVSLVQEAHRHIVLETEMINQRLPTPSVGIPECRTDKNLKPALPTQLAYPNMSLEALPIYQHHSDIQVRTREYRRSRNFTRNASGRKEINKEAQQSLKHGYVSREHGSTCNKPYQMEQWDDDEIQAKTSSMALDRDTHCERDINNSTRASIHGATISSSEAGTKKAAVIAQGQDQCDNISTTINEQCGAQLENLSPITKVPEFVLPPRTGRECKISWFSTPSNFWLHLACRENDLAQMHSTIQAYTNICVLTKVSVGQMVLVSDPADPDLYRGVVVAIKDNKAKVHYVDVGESKIVEISRLKVMPEMFMKEAAFAIHCRLVNVKPQIGEKWPTNNDAVNQEHTDFVCRVEGEAEDGVYPVSLRTIFGEDLAFKLVEKNLAVFVNESLTPGPGSCFRANVIVFAPGLRFVAHDLARSTELEHMQAQLQLEAKKFHVVAKPNVNDIIGARSKEDNTWYRARVTDLNLADGVEVMYVDYGNTEVVQAVYHLPERYKSIPFFGTKCQLAVKCEKSFEAEAMFENVIGDNNLTVQTYLKNNEGALLCNVITDNHVDFIKLLTTKNLAVPRVKSAYVSSLQSLDEIYVQFLDVVDQLSEIEEFLAKSSLESFDCPTEGSLCAAVFPDDGKLYRAVVKSISSDTTAQFIDYGNSAIVSVLKTLPNELLQIKPLAVKCQLKNIPDAEAERNDLCNILYSDTIPYKILIHEETQDRIMVSFMKGNISILELVKYNNVLKIEDPLQDVTTTAVENNMVGVKVISTVGSKIVWLQREDAENTLISLQIELSQLGPVLLHYISQGMFCAVRSTTSNYWFRAIITTPPTVLLVDYGREDTADLYKELPTSLKKIPIQANKYYIKYAPSDKTKLEQLNTYLMNEHNMKAEFNPGGCVTLFKNNKNILDVINVNVKITELMMLHFVSLSEFYVQLFSDIPLHNLIRKSLTEDTELLGNVETGMYCAVFHEQQWYRGIVELGHTAFLVDEGRHASVTKYRLMDDDLAKVKYLAVLCKLKDYPTECSKELEQAVKNLKIFSAEHEVVSPGLWSLTIYNKYGINILDEICSETTEFVTNDSHVSKPGQEVNSDEFKLPEYGQSPTQNSSLDSLASGHMSCSTTSPNSKLKKDTENLNTVLEMKTVDNKDLLALESDQNQFFNSFSGENMSPIVCVDVGHFTPDKQTCEAAIELFDPFYCDPGTRCNVEDSLYDIQDLNL